MEPLDGDTTTTIFTQSEWIIWNSNGDNGDNGDNGENEYNGDLIAIGANRTSICSIEWIQWRQLPHSPNYMTLLPEDVSNDRGRLLVATLNEGRI